MKSSRGDNCFKTVDHLGSLVKACIITTTCVSCEQCSLIDNRLGIFHCFSFCFKQDLKKLYVGDFYVT